MFRFAVFTAFTCLSASLSAQSTASWIRTDKTDALRGTSYVEFKLIGKFLTPPKGRAQEVPEMVVHCVPGKTLRIYNGRFQDGYVDIGAVLDSKIVERYAILTGSTMAEGLPVRYRLDDGKIQYHIWNVSTDRRAAFFEGAELNNMFYGHASPHKENAGTSTKKIVIAVNEYLAAEIVIQFDMPDPSEIADVCGAIAHKR